MFEDNALMEQQRDGLTNVHALSAENLHSEHCRKSNSSRLEERNPANESTILKKDGRDDVTNTRGQGAPNLT